MSSANYENNFTGQSNIVIKGRCTSLPTSISDVAGSAILTDQQELLLTAAQLDISSSSTADDGSPVGTGARTLKLIGLAADKITIQTETITLDGQNIVTTVNTWYRLYWVMVTTAGSGGTNAGDIYIVKTGTGGTYSGGVPGTFTSASAIAKILLQTNQGGSSIYTTPNVDGFLWKVKRITISARAQAGTFYLQTAEYGAGDPYYRQISFEYTSGGYLDIDLTDYNLEFGKNADIRLVAAAATAGSIISANAIIQRVSKSGIGDNSL